MPRDFMYPETADEAGLRVHKRNLLRERPRRVSNIAGALRDYSKPVGIPEPTCPADCGHGQCDRDRHDAAQPCNDCGQPIGYGRDYWHNLTGYRHKVCHG